MDSILNKEFPGKIIEDFDEEQKRGRYKVYVPELMYGIYDVKEQNGIFCVNHTNKTRDAYIEEEDPDDKKPAGGTYIPLQKGTRVIVKFFSEDFESGYIDRVISDYYSKSQPVRIDSNERDDYYQIIRTKKNDLIAISTTDGNGTLPEHSLHIYFDKNHVQIICNKDGLSISSEKDIQMKSVKNVNIIATESINLAAPIINLSGEVCCPASYVECKQFGCNCFNECGEVDKKIDSQDSPSDDKNTSGTSGVSGVG
jgi:hypothetical protein